MKNERKIVKMSSENGRAMDVNVLVCRLLIIFSINILSKQRQQQLYPYINTKAPISARKIDPDLCPSFEVTSERKSIMGSIAYTITPGDSSIILCNHLVNMGALKYCDILRIIKRYTHKCSLSICCELQVALSTRCGFWKHHLSPWRL